MKKTLSIVFCVLLVLLAVACSPETHKHTWNDGEKTLPATCEASGVMTYTCTVCGETKKEEIPALGHTHAEDATPVTINRYANCLLEGYATYVCSRCNQNYQDVTEKDYTNHVYFDSKAKGTENDPYYKTVTAETKDYYTWSTAAEKEKTQFTPASLVAYCNGCNNKITSITKPDTDGDTTTEADYKDILGTWVFKEVKADKDELGLSLRIYKDDETYKIDAYGWTYTYTAETTETFEYSSVTGTFNHGTEGRTFSFTMADQGSITAFKTKKVTLGEDENGLYIIVADLNKTTGSPSTGLAVNTDYPLHNGEKMYTDADKTKNPTSIGTAYLSYDATHLAHTWYAMKSSLGFKTWNVNTAQSTATTAAHYKACECGIAYLEEKCVQKSDGTALDANSESTSVCYLCGYNAYSGKYVNCQIGNQKTFTDNKETLLIPAESIVTLPYSTYKIFNGKKVSIDGWTGFVNAVNSGSGMVKVTADKAVLTYSLHT